MDRSSPVLRSHVRAGMMGESNGPPDGSSVYIPDGPTTAFENKVVDSIKRSSASDHPRTVRDGGGLPEI